VTVSLPQELLDRACVRAVQQGRVLTVTLDRPEARNAQTPSTWAALSAIGDACRGRDVDLVVIRGAGTAFSAGLDRRMFSPEGIPGEVSLAGLAALPDDDLASMIEEFQRGFLWQRAVAPLTVAAVHGPAIGAGFQLALACDMVLATPSASFAMRETSYGLVPDLAGTQPLVRAVGYSRAVDLCATGRVVSGAEGYDLGFVTRLVDDLDAALGELIQAVESAPQGAIADLLPVLASAETAHRGDQARVERMAQVGRLRTLLGGH
jgi:enoyl-CoA hydratase/carnithine racemase